MEGSRPFDSEVDFDQPRRNRPADPPPLRSRRPRRRPRAGGGDGDGPRRGRSETLARIAWAVPWIAIAITIVIVGGELFAAAMIGFACVGIGEFFRMTSEARPFLLVALAAAAALVVAAFYGSQYQMMIALAASVPVVFAAAVARPDRDGVTVSVAVTMLGIVWIAIPFAHAVLLRELPGHGAALLVDVLVATFVFDTAAYAGGRMFGRHRLAPALSPNKTLEGLAFGFVGGTLGFWFAGLYQDWLPGLDALLMGMCVAALAPVGDLFESMIKRDLQIKDSGTIFGPHGGLLDRLDAVMFTVVAGYYLAVAFVY
ncbi:MAG: phosphatidate cytidylyltransferase [Solirubrobacterales bacterium]|jgi:phosphatidate cytidylyltransferase|nr:phosphatidate cytidylyltransferase [Solirubrobacterales bacterium]